ncbi:2OG-Fe dioxygenase family protein [Paraburkholderia fungorum]|uniref:2OG-Fe dioxygenase family protein n=1 Tax=Paraburkholderia fungorum TaxID=134537 RepID=UPI0038BD32AD
MRNMLDEFLLTSRAETDRVAKQLRESGWARFDSIDLSPSPQERTELALLAQYAETLPVDRFGGGGRRRSYAQGVIDVHTQNIAWDSGYVAEDGSVEIKYQQDVDFQPEYGGVVRRFLRTSDRVLDMSLVNKLIWHDLWLTSLAAQHDTLICGLHVVCMTATVGSPSRITPDCLHRDGQPFTAVHLIDRKNACGGINYIAPPIYAGAQVSDVPRELLHSFTLNEPLESYVIDDEAVSHHVTSVSCEQSATHGVRTVMLIDFTHVSPGGRA